MLTHLLKLGTEFGVAQITEDFPVILIPVWCVGAGFYAFLQYGQLEIQTKANALIGKVMVERSTVVVPQVQLAALQVDSPVEGRNTAAIHDGVVFFITDGKISNDLKITVEKAVVHHVCCSVM